MACEHPNHKTKYQNQHQCSSLFYNSSRKRIFSYSFLKSNWNKLKKKLYFTTLNYAPNYTLHPKLSECILYTLNYYTYHTLHPGVTFPVMFDRILLHVLGTYFLLMWNKRKRLKHPTSKSIKTKAIFFQISYLACLSPNLDSSQNLRSHPPNSPIIQRERKNSNFLFFVLSTLPTHPSSKEKEKTQIFFLLFFLWPERSMKENDENRGRNYEKRNSKLTIRKVLLL